MKSSQNILFVDDDSRLLRGLQRALGNQVGFGLFFAEKGAGAFDIINNNQIDFVVSGNKAGDMSGDMLLERVKKLKPESIRVMFSSGDTERAGESETWDTASVHRYINRPCDSIGMFHILKDLGERYSFLPAVQRSRVFSAQSPALLPETADYLATCDLSIVNTRELTDILAWDPGFICWAIFSQRRRIGSMKYTSLSELVRKFVGDGILLHNGELNRQVIKTYSDSRLLRYQRMIYDHCLSTSAMACEIARGIYGDNNLMISHALLAGLLHDIGRLILAEQYLQQHQADNADVAIDRISSIDSEREVYGIDHCQFAAMLYSLWGLPEDVVGAISQHHESAEDVDDGCLVNILKAADMQAYLKCENSLR